MNPTELILCTRLIAEAANYKQAADELGSATRDDRQGNASGYFIAAGIYRAASILCNQAGDQNKADVFANLANNAVLRGNELLKW